MEEAATFKAVKRGKQRRKKGRGGAKCKAWSSWLRIRRNQRVCNACPSAAYWVLFPESRITRIAAWGNRQPRWTNLQCRKEAGGPCAPAPSQSEALPEAVPCLISFSGLSTLQDLLPVVLHASFCTAGPTRSLHYTRRIRHSCCAGILDGKIFKQKWLPLDPWCSAPTAETCCRRQREPSRMCLAASAVAPKIKVWPN